MSYTGAPPVVEDTVTGPARPSGLGSLTSAEFALHAVAAGVLSLAATAWVLMMIFT